METLCQDPMLHLGVRGLDDDDELFLDDMYLKNVLELNFMWYFCKMATTSGLHS